MQGGEIFGKESRFFEKYDEIVAAAGGGKSRTQALDRSKNLNAVPVSLGELELERKAALEEYMAMCADCDADVYRFRNKVLEGEPLAQDQARELLKSPAAATLETRIIKEADIPVVGHTAKMTSFERELLPHGASHVATLTVVLPASPEKYRRSPCQVPRMRGSVAS